MRKCTFSKSKRDSFALNVLLPHTSNNLIINQKLINKLPVEKKIEKKGLNFEEKKLPCKNRFL